MHTLTKVFIVLWALVSVFIMALAVPLVTNNDSWKARYQGAIAERSSFQAQADLAKRELDLANIAKAQEASALNKVITDLRTQQAQATTRQSELRSQLAESRKQRDETAGQIATLTSATETQAGIIDTQSEEITRRREESLALMRQSIELEDHLRDTLSKLDVALDAQRILQEQIARFQERDVLPREVTVGDDVTARRPRSPAVAGRVLNVQMGADGTRYAEVSLGSRDGVAENMKFIIARGGNFLGNLIVTQVDLNRSVGRIELEQERVAINDQVRGGVQ